MTDTHTEPELQTWATTIGDLADALDRLKPRTPMRAVTLDSYRGYYECLAISETERITDAQEVAREVRRAIGTIYTGYKGGDYTMHAGTRVYRAQYGETGHAVTGVHVGRDGASFQVAPEGEWY